MYGETTIDKPGYTKIGTVSDAGIALIQQIASKGTVPNDVGVKDKPAEALQRQPEAWKAGPVASAAPVAPVPEPAPAAAEPARSEGETPAS